MNLNQIDGLPLHILIVHFTVVIVPLAAILTMASATWPAARRRLGVATPLLALAALVLVPITTNAGLWLEERVSITPAIAHHVALGETLLPWVIALFAVAVVQWAWHAFFARQGAIGHDLVRAKLLRSTITLVIVAAVAVSAVGTIVMVVRIGEAGSAAVWQGRFNDTVPG